MNTLERKTHCFVPPKKNKSELSMIGITGRNSVSIYIFCQLDQSTSDYFYKILLGGALSRKNAFHSLNFDEFWKYGPWN